MIRNRTKTIWVLEDEPGARFVYKSILEPFYDLKFFECIGTFKKALSKSHKNLIDFLIIDLKLKNESFVSFLDTKEGKKLMESYLFMVVSGLDETNAIQTSFRCGAIDYITKPFGREELLFKIEKSLNDRRTTYCNKINFELDFIKFKAKRNNIVSEELTTKEFKILSIIAASPKNQATRKYIQKEIWSNSTVSSKSLDVHIHHIRQKIKPLDLEITYSSPHYSLEKLPK